MKHPNSAPSPVQLLRSYKSTPTSLAAHAVDQAVRSAADSDVLRAVDSAVGQVFYSAVYEPVYIRTWCAVFATWLTKREIHFMHKASAFTMIDRQLRTETSDTALGSNRRTRTESAGASHPSPPPAPPPEARTTSPSSTPPTPLRSSPEGSPSRSKTPRNRPVFATVLAVILAIILVSFVILSTRESRDTSARRAVNQPLPQESLAAGSTAPSTQESTLVKPTDLTPEEQELLNNGQYIERYGPTEHSGHSVIRLSKAGDRKNAKPAVCFVFGMEDAELARKEGESMAQFHYNRSQAEQFLFAQGWDKYHDRFFTRCYVQEGTDAYNKALKRDVKRARRPIARPTEHEYMGTTDPNAGIDLAQLEEEEKLIHDPINYQRGRWTTKIGQAFVVAKFFERNLGDRKPELDALADRLGAQKRYVLIEKQKRGGVWWVRVFLYKR
jgi:hypothetical protein